MAAFSPYRFCAATALLILLVGCSQSFNAADSSKLSEYDQYNSRSGEMELATAAKSSPAEATKLVTGKRKIIFSAKLSIVVENFDPVEAAIEKTVNQFEGFIADSNIDTRNRQGRRGDWTIRIPVKNFDAFLNAAGSIGIPISRSRDAQDVTEEYVDIEARIANKKKLEARILELLDRPDDKIQHVIEVEKELGRVREEIERMEGRVRYLKDRIELTTVTIDIREERQYHPPEEPGFTNRISRAWTNSIANTKRFLEDFAVWVVGNLFAILFWLVAIILLVRLIRRKIKKYRAARRHQ